MKNLHLGSRANYLVWKKKQNTLVEMEEWIMNFVSTAKFYNRESMLLLLWNRKKFPL